MRFTSYAISMTVKMVVNADKSITSWFEGAGNRQWHENIEQFIHWTELLDSVTIVRP
jgi:hypothetical protein